MVENVGHRTHVCSIVFDELPKSSSLSAQVTVPKDNGHGTIHGFDPTPAVNFQLLLNYFLAAAQPNAAACVTQVDVMFGPE